MPKKNKNIEKQLELYDERTNNFIKQRNLLV